MGAKEISVKSADMLETKLTGTHEGKIPGSSGCLGESPVPSRGMYLIVAHL